MADFRNTILEPITTIDFGLLVEPETRVHYEIMTLAQFFSDAVYVVARSGKYPHKIYNQWLYSPNKGVSYELHRDLSDNQGLELEIKQNNLFETSTLLIYSKFTPPPGGSPLLLKVELFRVVPLLAPQ